MRLPFRGPFFGTQEYALWWMRPLGRLAFFAMVRTSDLLKVGNLKLYQRSTRILPGGTLRRVAHLLVSARLT